MPAPVTKSKYWPLLITAPLFLTIGAGLVFDLLPAFGFLPALGGRIFSIAPWHMLIAAPGLLHSVGITLFSGLLATLFSTLLAFGTLALVNDRLQQHLIRFNGLLLATPPAAIAIGLAFVIAPSGWLFRFLAYCCVRFDRPPDVLLLQDPWGLSLSLALSLKETPFLLLIGFVALRQIDAQRYLQIAQSLGYQRFVAWIKIILPLLYRQMRLPIFAVMAYALSVVDMSLILGPSNPPTLALRILYWMNDPDLSYRFMAAAGALLQTGLLLSTWLVWQGLLLIGARIGAVLISDGRRRLNRVALFCLSWLVYGIGLVGASLGCLSVVSLTLWSFAALWPFPDPLPQWTIQGWVSHSGQLMPVLGTSLWIAFWSVILAMLMVLICLEWGRQAERPGLRLLYAPLIVPEIAFMFGIAILLILIGIDGTIPAVVWCHLLFLFPYLYLALLDPWDQLDPRYERIARTLGASRWKVFFSIKLPLLRGPLCNAIALGLAVSLSLYLPTVVAGAGRVSTLATEAIQLAAAGDRRITAIFALVQCLCIWLGFIVLYWFGRPRFRLL